MLDRLDVGMEKRRHAIEIVRFDRAQVVEDDVAGGGHGHAMPRPRESMQAMRCAASARTRAEAEPTYQLA